MKKISASIFILPFIVLNAFTNEFDFSSNSLRIKISPKGNIVSLHSLELNKEFFSEKGESALLRVKVNNEYFLPEKAEYKNNGIIKLYFENRISVEIKVKQNQQYITFEVISVNDDEGIQAVVWGPVPTIISEIVGEIIGVVRNKEFAIGLMGINLKTPGGFPYNDEGWQSARGTMAEAREFGSVLQAYSLNRAIPRKIDVWEGNFPNMPVPPIKGETVTGSKIALYGCLVDNVLDVIEQIEISEGLPHIEIDGVWTKRSPETGRSYLIASFDESNIDVLLNHAERANLMTLYHMDPFESWGHYNISTQFFPDGIRAMRKCVEKAKKKGIRIGAHTLTNFIQTHDPYITPVPDKRLARTGNSILVSAITENSTEIHVQSPEYFNNEKANWLHTVMIDEELIRYHSVTDHPPYKLLDCQRGAFETKAAAHKKGSEVGKLLDHPYEVFFPNFDMQNEIALNMAKTFNATGMGQMDFDGFEGCLSSGQGDYGLNVFAKTFIDNLDHTVINGTSRSKSYYWHINTYCNWGEPWYSGFRESMQQYRINNQGLFDRNYLPNMLGWYLLTETTSLADIEWMLARGAGYGAGYALATDIDAVNNNGDIEIIMDAIREWEKLRHSRAFSNRLREKLKDPSNEFHLEKIGEYNYNLYAFNDSEEYIYKKTVRQSGEPVGVKWELNNPDNKQKMQFKLIVEGEPGSISNPVFEIDKFVTIKFPVELKVGEALLCDGTENVRIYDEKGRQMKTITPSVTIPNVNNGKNQIVFNCDFKGSPSVKIIFKTRGKLERISVN